MSINEENNEDLEMVVSDNQETFFGAIEDNEEVEDSVSEMVENLEKDLKEDSKKVETNDVNVDSVIALMDAMKKTNEALDSDKIVEYLMYLLCGESRPAWAEQLLADGDNRLKEYEMIMILRSMTTLPKVESSTAILLDSIIKDLPNLKFMTVTEKMSVLERLSKYKKDILDSSHNYNKLSKDIQSLPMVYRQLLDELFKVPTSKIERLKLLPSIIDVSDEQWERIVEISKMK